MITQIAQNNTLKMAGDWNCSEARSYCKVNEHPACVSWIDCDDWKLLYMFYSTLAWWKWFDHRQQTEYFVSISLDYRKKKHINIQHSIYPQHSKYGRWLKLSWWKELFQSNSECFSWTFGWWLEIVTCFIVHADWWWIRISVLSFSYTWYCSTVICGHIDLIKLDGKLDKCI